MYSNAWVSSSFYPGIIFITEKADYADKKRNHPPKRRRAGLDKSVIFTLDTKFPLWRGIKGEDYYSSGELPTLPLDIHQMSFFTFFIFSF